MASLLCHYLDRLLEEVRNQIAISTCLWIHIRQSLLGQIFLLPLVEMASFQW